MCLVDSPVIVYFCMYMGDMGTVLSLYFCVYPGDIWVDGPMYFVCTQEIWVDSPVTVYFCVYTGDMGRQSCHCVFLCKHRR